jgi:DNA-binding Lrp family transcriptional regulator
MDEKDIKILSTLSKTRTRNSEEIAAETGIPKSTVHYRIDNLRSAGIIENDLFDIDISKLGINITLITDVNAEYEENYHDDVGEKLANIDGVNQVYFTMGDTDFVVVSHLTDREMIERLIEDFESIDEIQRTSSRFVIKTIKNEPHPLSDFELETLTSSLLSADR